MNFHLKGDMIETILDHFEFHRVKVAMDALDWKWQLSKPEIYELRQCARRLLSDVSRSSEDCSYSTGGFTATKCGDNISLSFSVDEVNSRDLEALT